MSTLELTPSNTVEIPEHEIENITVDGVDYEVLVFDNKCYIVDLGVTLEEDYIEYAEEYLEEYHRELNERSILC